MLEQPALRIADKSVTQARRPCRPCKMPALIAVARHLANCVLILYKPPAFIVLPRGGLARTVGIARDLSVRAPCDLRRTALRVRDRDRQACAIVFVLRYSPKRIERLGDAPLAIVVALPPMTFRVLQSRQIMVTIVDVVRNASIALRMRSHLPRVVPRERFLRSIRKHVPRQVLVRVAHEPFFSAIGVDGAVYVPVDVVVLLRRIAERVGHESQAQIIVPSQTGVEGSVICPFANCFRVQARTVPLQIHPPSGAVAVSRHEVMRVRVAP
ncbi:hypothetical protein FEP87_05431 [Burkholderia multivorans]|nr:hypothetical protein [Burkholderia multivorans]